MPTHDNDHILKQVYGTLRDDSGARLSSVGAYVCVTAAAISLLICTDVDVRNNFHYVVAALVMHALFCFSN